LNKLVSLWLGSSEKIIWKHEGVKNRAVSKKYLLYFKIQSSEPQPNPPQFEDSHSTQNESS
jgi:hypothetical protein